MRGGRGVRLGAVRRRRAWLVAALATVLSGTGFAPVLVTPAAAALPPLILNSGLQNSGNAQWMETQGQPDDGGASVKQFWATFLVQHALGRSINQVGIVAAGTTSIVPVTGQTYVASAGRIETSRVTVAIGIGKPGGFSCPFFGGGTRSVDSTVTMRVIDSSGESSGNVNTTVKFVEDANCSTGADFPRMTSVSQTATEVVPGTNITYNFSCSDPDPDFLSSDDDCDRANIRWRRLDDGEVSAITLRSGINDDTAQSHAMSFPSQGYYVVEAQLGNENGSFPGTAGSSQGWWRLGNAVVNDSASSLSGSLSFSGTQPSSPPSVNPGTAVTSTASVADTGGTIQVIEWDADGNSTFERREYSVPANVGGNIVHPALTLAELQQSVNTATPGLKTVNARITDNGALDAADNIRRQRTFSAQLRVNAVPTASNVSATSNEGTPVSITLAGNDPDNQPGFLVYSIVSAPPATAGTLSAIFGNHVTFTPAAGFSGSTSFTYRAADGPASNNGAFAFSNTATVNVTVSPVNDLPTVDPKSAATNEDTAVNIQATGTDAEGPLTWAVASQPTNGSATCHGTSGLCTYTPAPDFFGSDSFVVRGTDTGGASATATFAINVAPVNDAPAADDQLVTLAEDVTTPITLTASDVDDSALTFTAPVDDVDHGTLACDGGSCSYTPAPDYNGTDSFTFTVSDGGSSDSGTVSIVVTPVNDAPVAVDVPDADTDEDVDLPLVLGGTDVDGDAVTVSGVSDPDHGTATITAPNGVVYVGDANFHGTDTFDFDVTDGHDAFDTGSVVVTVHPVNDAPVVDDQAFEGPEDTALPISIAAGDVDGDELGFTVLSSPASGTLSGTGPDFTYDPGPEFFGADAFTVRAVDGNGGVDEASIAITVTPVNDAPVADDLEVTTDEDTSASFDLTATDVDGDAVSFEIITSPTNGLVTCVAAACEYEPTSHFNGSDLVVFRATDPSGAADTGTIAITVTPVNDAPVAGDLLVTTDEDVPVAITLTATDVDGDLLTFVPGTPASGDVSGTPPDVVYASPPDFWGSDAFTFSVSDGRGGSDEGSVGITVVEVNDPPVAADLALETPANTAVTFALTAADVDGDPLTFSILLEPTSGSVSCDLSVPECVYTPAANEVGVVTLEYGVSDGRGGADTGLVTITVSDVVPPTVVIRSPADGSSLLLGSSVTVDYECADDISLATCVGDVADGAALDTSTPGPATFSVVATDAAGNQTTASAEYAVLYAFDGFKAPVDNDGVRNLVTAGSKVPLRWRISGAAGGISDAASVASLTSRPIPCASESVQDIVEETVSTPSGLNHLHDGNWEYTWATSRSWRNTCRELALRLDDGTLHTALFGFR